HGSGARRCGAVFQLSEWFVSAVRPGWGAGILRPDRDQFSVAVHCRRTKAQQWELGIVSSVVALTWAGAGYLVGRRSDRAGRRKPYYVAAIIVFSLCSMTSGLTGGFLGLILTRLMMGAAEGPVPVLGNALLLGASTPSRRGLNMGILSLSGILIGGPAPLILVSVATHLGWRTAFFFTGIPGLLAAIAVAKFVR